MLYTRILSIAGLFALGIVAAGFLPETISVSVNANSVEVRALTNVLSGITYGPASATPAVVADETELVHPDQEEIVPSVATSRSSQDVLKHKSATEGIRTVPFYSQFTDISAPEWKKVGCGIASLAMLIAYYEPDTVSVDTLLEEGIAANAFLSDAGWTHAGLIGLSQKYGLSGESHSLAELSMEKAFLELEQELQEGPVMASVHYTFDPANTIPHLVVVNGVSNGKVYYNDPSEAHGGGVISIEQFKRAWKKRYIDIRPA